MNEAIARRGLVLLGCGKMGSALLAGWLARGLPADRVWVVEPRPSDWLKGLPGLNLNAPLQRQFRDIHAAAAHFGLTWDVHAVAYAQGALGLQPQAGMLL